MRIATMCLAVLLSACSATPTPAPARACPPLPLIGPHTDPVAHMRLLADMYAQCARSRA